MWKTHKSEDIYLIALAVTHKKILRLRRVALAASFYSAAVRSLAVRFFVSEEVRKLSYETKKDSHDMSWESKSTI